VNNFYNLSITKHMKYFLQEVIVTKWHAGSMHFFIVYSAPRGW